MNLIANDSGWRCPDCGNEPKTWWSTTCARCKTRILACSACRSRVTALAEARAHAEACGTQGDLGRVAPALLRPATRAGARLGFERRGTHGAVLGGAVGAALGAISDHVLGRPEIQPAARLARTLYDVFGEVRGAFKKKPG